jgi:hypothetical protein
VEIGSGLIASCSKKRESKRDIFGGIWSTKRSDLILSPFSRTKRSRKPLNWKIEILKWENWFYWRITKTEYRSFINGSIFYSVSLKWNSSFVFSFPFIRISSVSSILSESSFSSEKREGEGSSSVDCSCSCLVPFVSEVVSISTFIYSSLSPLSSVSEVSFSFLVTMGDGTLPK